MPPCPFALGLPAHRQTANQWLRSLDILLSALLNFFFFLILTVWRYLCDGHVWMVPFRV